MKLDILIKNGRVMDPARSIDAEQDVGVVANRIVDVPPGGAEAVQVVDAAGCYVFPGLIDFHTHCYSSGAVTAAKPDLMLATGVTATVDCGTTGCANYEAFYKTDVVNSHVRIKTYLNVYSGGMPDEWIPELIAPKYFNEKAIRAVVDKYGREILGLKVRIAGETCDSIEPLEATLDLAERIGGLGVCVHVTDAPCSNEDIARLLRPGDVFCHMYHGRRNTILDADGRVFPGIREARERGVVFDMSHGRGNFDNDLAARAMGQGFMPDIISTDMGTYKLYISHWPRSLSFTMSKMLCMGMDLPLVIRAVTATPAKLMGMEGEIGTLAPGAYADIALFTVEERKFRSRDFFNRIYVGDRLFMPKLVICNGDFVWAEADFNAE